MGQSIKDIIRKRRSVRTFSGQPLSEADKQSILESFNASINPFGIKVEFRFLDAKEHDLKSTVIVKADSYVAAKVEHGCEIAAGYSFEKFCLSLEELGIGTVMLAGTLNRENFEKAMGVENSEIMPVATPVGYAADKMSVREKLMRKAIGADNRMPSEELFFEEDFEHSLTPEHAGKFGDALEMVRLAPSAVNKQPWRAVVCGDKVHFYKKSNKMMANEDMDIQKVDMGIALAHFDLTLIEEGVSGRFVVDDPKLSDSLEYIITYIAN